MIILLCCTKIIGIFFPSVSQDVASFGFSQAFEQARRDAGCIFVEKGDVVVYLTGW